MKTTVNRLVLAMFWYVITIVGGYVRNSQFVGSPKLTSCNSARGRHIFLQHFFALQKHCAIAASIYTLMGVDFWL